MATTNFHLKIGCGVQQSIPSIILFECELQKNNIQQHYANLSKILNKEKVPTIVCSVSPLFNQLDLGFILNQLSQQQTYEVVESNNKFYHTSQFFSQDQIHFIKKIEKVLSQITELDNKLYLEAKIYNVDKFQEKIKSNRFDPFTIFLENIDINGKIDLDKKFFETIGLLVQKISPNFSEAPIMAAFDILQNLNFEIQMQSFQALDKQTRQNQDVFVTKFKGFDEEEDKENNNIYKKLIKCDEKADIYFHFGELGFLHLEFEVKLFPFLVKCSPPF